MFIQDSGAHWETGWTRRNPEPVIVFPVTAAEMLAHTWWLDKRWKAYKKEILGED